MIVPLFLSQSCIDLLLQKKCALNMERLLHANHCLDSLIPNNVHPVDLNKELTSHLSCRNTLKAVLNQPIYSRSHQRRVDLSALPSCQL